MLNFLFIPRVNVDLQRLPAPSGFHEQIAVDPLVDIITALWLLADMLTPAAGRKLISLYQDLLHVLFSLQPVT
jgi:hypothetical protein